MACGGGGGCGGPYRIICKVSGETGVAEMMRFESWRVRAAGFSHHSTKWNGSFSPPLPSALRPPHSFFFPSEAPGTKTDKQSRSSRETHTHTAREKADSRAVN